MCPCHSIRHQMRNERVGVMLVRWEQAVDLYKTGLRHAVHRAIQALEPLAATSKRQHPDIRAQRIRRDICFVRDKRSAIFAGHPQQAGPVPKQFEGGSSFENLYHASW